MADPKMEEILRMFRFSVTESAAGTFTQTSYGTNLSLERGVIWEVHFIDFEILPSTIDTPAAGADEQTQVQITRESKSALVNLDDADLIALVIAEVSRSSAIGTDAGPLWKYWLNPLRFNFNPPLLYGAANIYCAIKSTSGTARTGRGRVGYTLRSVTDKMFYQIATALLN